MNGNAGGAERIWAAAEEVLRADARLGPVVEQIGPCGLKPAGLDSVFTALLESIVYQQLNGRAAATILARVVALFPEPQRPTAPALAAIGDEALRGAGLSRGKLLAIRDLAAQSLAGALPTAAQAVELSDEELVRRLTAVRGIGPWTVHMLLIFRLGRPDVWPVGDYGVRTAVQRVFRRRALPDDRVMERLGRAWRPWRSVASWYLWRSLELPAKPGGGGGRA